MNDELKAEEIGAVILAFQNSNYLWRTVRGVARDTGLSIGTVLWVIHDYNETFIEASRLSVSGEKLYTTREHYKKQASVWQKLLGALRNRVA
jgi:hypothetical protein